MLLAAVRKICRAGTRHQIAIEPAAAGYSPFRDFVHCRFADAGRRWVWLRSPTAGIRKPSQFHHYRSVGFRSISAVSHSFEGEKTAPSTTAHLLWGGSDNNCVPTVFVVCW